MKMLALEVGVLAMAAAAAVTASALPGAQAADAAGLANDATAASPHGTDLAAMQTANRPRPANDSDCFNVQFVQGYSSVDRDTIRLDLGNRRAFEVDLSGPQCDQVEWTQRLALESTPGSWICVGNRPGQGEIHFRDPTTRRRLTCHVQDVRRVTEPAPGA